MVARADLAAARPVRHVAFKSDGGGGDERLYISWSPDGLNWTGLNNGQPVWQPPGWAGFWNVVRDPTIVFHEGYYWVAYTSGNYGRGTSFGLVKSADLLNWTLVGQIDAALPGQTGQITWSPIFFTDGDGSVHIVVALTPSGSDIFDITAMRVYELHPVNAAWTQWSAPVALQLLDPNTNDCWIWKEDTTYHAAYADLQRGGAVVHATSQNLLGGWVRDKVLGYPSQEGNIVLPLPGGGYRLYLEPGNGPGGTPTTYRTCDFDVNFSNATPQVPVNSDVPLRNGKLCAARGTLPFATWRAQNLGSLPVAQREPLADPDADGLKNLVEHALGSSATAFSPGQRRPQPFLRQFAGIWYAGLRFDWLPASADVKVQAEMRAANGAWTSAGLAVESSVLLSDGTMRTCVRANTPVGTSALFRVNATLATAAAATQAAPRSVDKRSGPKRTKREIARKPFR